MAPQISSFSCEPKRPKFWEKRVLAAYLRLMGASQKAVGAEIRRTTRCIQLWESDKVTWKLAQAEAAERWLDDVTNAARKTVLDAVRSGDAQLAMAILERRLPELAPPKSRVEITIRWDSLTDDQLRRIASGESPVKVLGTWHTNGSTPHQG